MKLHGGTQRSLRGGVSGMVYVYQWWILDEEMITYNSFIIKLIWVSVLSFGDVGMFAMEFILWKMHSELGPLEWFTPDLLWNNELNLGEIVSVLFDQ